MESSLYPATAFLVNLDKRHIIYICNLLSVEDESRLSTAIKLRNTGDALGLMRVCANKVFTTEKL
jgi:hypothetical protein